MIKIIKTFWRKHQLGKRLITSCILVSVLSLSLPKVSYAADDPSIRDKTLIETVTHLSTAMQYINLILWPILILSGDLLDSSIFLEVPLVKTDDYLTQGAAAEEIGTMEDRLLTVWVQIRNIVNIIFVVLLLFVALYNVLGRTEGEFTLKSALPKIAIGLIAVNFSFLICKVVLDVTNVLTTAVMALPINSLNQDFETEKENIATGLCKYTTVDATTKKETSAPVPKEQIDAWGLGAICELTADNKESTGKFIDTFEDSFLAKADHKNLAFIITAQIAKLAQLKYVSTQITAAAETAIGEDLLLLLLEILTNLIILILYIVSIIALFVVLIARLVVLWALIALSPLLILFMSIPQLKQQMEEFDFQKLFIQHSIAPILIVGSMSIGYILLASMASKDTTIVFPNDSLNGDVAASFGLPFAAFNTMPNFLATIAGVAVIFMGVFGAASKTSAKVVTDGLRNMTTAGAKWLAKTPLYWIRIPVKKQGGATVKPEDRPSLGDALNIASMAIHGGDQRRRAETMAKWEKIDPISAAKYGGRGVTSRMNLQSAITEGNKSLIGQNIMSYITDTRLQSPNDFALLNEGLKKMDIQVTVNSTTELQNKWTDIQTGLQNKGGVTVTAEQKRGINAAQIINIAVPPAGGASSSAGGENAAGG